MKKPPPPWQNLRTWLVSLAPSSVKYALFTSALILLGCFTILNQVFINNLEERAVQVNHKEARLYAVAIAEQLNKDEINVIFNEIVLKSEVPMIITDDRGLPINWNNIGTGFWGGGRNQIQQVPYYYLNKSEQDFLRREVARFDRKNQPLPLEAEGHNLGYLHYGELPLIPLLSWMPLVELLVIFLFCFVGYFGFYIIRSNEQSVLWVGLAKETAHQLGTPISSLLGWIDYLRLRLADTPESARYVPIMGEMESDIQRLNKVATRFSQIGSVPELKQQQINQVIEATAAYFGTRLPQVGKKIELKLELQDVPEIWMNRELMGWVFENLIRNAVDSIEVKQGLITISSAFAPQDEGVRVTVSDNGKGIPREHLKQIFNPGFTTKKRGWGLGLSLCRRIVEDYHGGKIYVERSQREVGTAFAIALPLSPKRIGGNKA